jgi:hypothetical protein
MINLHCPLSLIGNPYLNIIKLIFTEFLKKIIIKKSDLTYFTTNTINNDIISVKNINKQINNKLNNDFELMCKFEEYKEIDKSILNNYESENKYKLINNYKIEYIRVLHIKRYFIENYIDATKLKNAHLKNNCGKRKIKQANVI